MGGGKLSKAFVLIGLMSVIGIGGISFIPNVQAEIKRKCVYEWNGTTSDEEKFSAVVTLKESKNNVLNGLEMDTKKEEIKLSFGTGVLKLEKEKCPEICIGRSEDSYFIWNDEETCKRQSDKLIIGGKVWQDKNAIGAVSMLPGSLVTYEEDSDGTKQDFNIAKTKIFNISDESDDKCIYKLEQSANALVWEPSSITHTITITSVRPNISGITASCDIKSSDSKRKVTCSIVNSVKTQKILGKSFYAEGKKTTGSFKCLKSLEVKLDVPTTASEERNKYEYRINVKESKEEKQQYDEEWLPKAEGPTKEECEKDPTIPGCVKNSCEVIDTGGELFKILKQIIGYVQIGSIFAVLIFCVLDLGGAVASSDDDAFRKARNTVFKRIIALILIFLVPLFIKLIVNLVNLGACKEEDYDFIGNLFN